MKIIALFLFLSSSILIAQSKILINMDLNQSDHLKAYGLVFNELKNGATADWLLNYKGGSFMLDETDDLILKCRLKGVSFEQISHSQVIEVYS